MDEVKLLPCEELYPPSRRTHGIYGDEEAARDGAYNLARLLNGVPSGWVLYTMPKMDAWAVCSCRAEEMVHWQKQPEPRP